MKTQKEMFYAASRKNALDGLLNQLIDAQISYSKAVASWRADGADESLWERYTGDASRSLDQAQKNVDQYI